MCDNAWRPKYRLSEFRQDIGVKKLKNAFSYFDIFLILNQSKNYLITKNNTYQTSKTDLFELYTIFSPKVTNKR